MISPEITGCSSFSGCSGLSSLFERADRHKHYYGIVGKSITYFHIIYGSFSLLISTLSTILSALLESRQMKFIDKIGLLVTLSIIPINTLSTIFQK